MTAWRAAVGRLVFGLGVLLLPLAGTARAERSGAVDMAGLSDAELLAMIAAVEARLAGSRPLAIVGVPAGFGPGGGRVFAGIAATDRRDRIWPGDWDASLSLGKGFGDARQGLGFAIVADVTSVSPHHFGSSGTLGLGLYRELPGPDPSIRLGLGLGLENLLRWGDSRRLAPEAHLALSARLAGHGGTPPLLLTTGYGSAIAVNGAQAGWFAGLGVGVSRHVGASLAWQGDELMAALHLAPSFAPELSLMLGMGDVTDRVNGRRLLFGLTWSRAVARR